MKLCPSCIHTKIVNFIVVKSLKSKTILIQIMFIGKGQRD